MKSKIEKMILLFLVFIMMSGCFGSNQMFNRMHKWNSKVDNKYGRSAVHLAFWIIPVYEVAILGDVIVLNVIEFWSGKNPMAMNDSESETEEIEYAGKVYEVTATKEGFTVKDKETEKTDAIIYSPNDKTWHLGEMATVD